MKANQSRLNSDEGANQGDGGGEGVYGHSSEDKGGVFAAIELGVFT